MGIKKFNESYVVSEYLKGRNTKDLATELNTYNTSIRRILLRNNVPLRSISEVSNKTVKIDRFKNIADPTVQYWLGMLATDGCITNGRVVLQLQEQDIYLLDAFCKFLSDDITITQTFHKKYQKAEFRVQFRNKQIIETLTTYGITPRKSMTLKMLIPITRSFLLGCLDGDGSVIISKTQNSGRIDFLSGSRIFCGQILAFLDENNIAGKICKAQNLFRVSVHRQKEIIKLYEFLYSNIDHVFMLRKYEKYQQLISKINTSKYLKRQYYYDKPPLIKQ